MGEVGAFRAAVVGAGASGILAAIKLRELGVDDVVVYEKSHSLGGTWRDNTYPGLRCDVPSHLYRYSFEPNPDWSQFYSPGSEILAYFVGVARKHNVDRLVRFNSEVVQCEFVEDGWEVSTAAGECEWFNVVITATGVLHHIVYPDVPGMDRFEGASFHTARWDHNVDLKDRSVAIVGTGSSAVQVLSAIVDCVGSVTLYQRTPQWIMDVPNGHIPETKRALFRENPGALQDFYDHLAQQFNHQYAAALVGENEEALSSIQSMCEENLRKNVHDASLRKRLTPDYPAGCKRLVVSSDFYAALQKENAELVDSPIHHVEADGIQTEDGTLHQHHVIVYATGFDAHRIMRPMEVIGPDCKLSEAWAHENRAYATVSIPRFPNLFMLGGPNSPIGNVSFLMTVETQMGFISQLIRRLLKDGIRRIAAREEATDRFLHDLKEAMSGTVWVAGCQSWFMDKNGNVASWPWSFERFQALLSSPEIGDFDVW